MKRNKVAIVAAGMLIVLILDSQSVLTGAVTAVEMCIKVVIPSLFPFIFITSFMLSNVTLEEYKSLHWISRLFRTPFGTETMLLSGFLGGYPMGAKIIGQAAKENTLSRFQVRRMLPFCNAAGPSFIFGMTGTLFSTNWVPWTLWALHIASAYCVANLIPSRTATIRIQTHSNAMNVSENLRCSIRTMAEICGWIFLMRILITVMEKHFLWVLPEELRILITGILELSNGCLHLSELETDGMKYVLCAFFLGFGGLCVALQTASVAQDADQRLYLPGKLVQGLISFLMGYLLQILIFDPHDVMFLPPWLIIGLAALGCILIIYIRKYEIRTGNSDSLDV